MKVLMTAIALLSFTGHLEAMSFKAEIQPLKLPILLSSTQPPVVKYTPPGEISVGLMRMCGDGDVAHFSGVHKDFEFVPHEVKNLNVILGYWVVEDGDSPVPTSDNFYPVGYNKASISEKMNTVTYSGSFLPMNKSFSPGPNGLSLIATDLINLQKIAGRSFEPNKNYRIYSGAFTCINPENEDSLKSPGQNFKYSPSPVEIAHVLSNTNSTGLYGRLNNALQDVDPSSEDAVTKFLQKNDKIDYKAEKSETIYKSTSYEAGSQAPLKFNLGNNGKVKISDATVLWGIFKDLMTMAYPDFSALPETATDSDKLKAYKEALSSASVTSKLTAIPNATSSYCSSLGLNLNSENPQFKWEAFPMNLSCKFLLNDGELKSAFNALYKPDALPAPEDFHKMKLKLASRFYLGAAYHTVQKAIHEDSDIKIERPNCFNTTGKPMISRLIGSFPFQFQYNSTEKAYKLNSTYSHIHPEPLFALVDYERYFASDATAIWGQVLTPDQSKNIQPESWGIRLPLKDKTLNEHGLDSATFNSSPINILFKIRSVGGSCPMFC